MNPLFEHGEAVRVTRNLRNDGTFPGVATGTVLVPAGAVGHVRDVGTFLQDQLIYTVHFIELERMVGCREEELIAADAPWVESRFQRRDEVVTRQPLAIAGELVAAAGSRGEVVDVLRFEADGVIYHVRFPGHTVRVPEAALDLSQDGESA